MYVRKINMIGYENGIAKESVISREKKLRLSFQKEVEPLVTTSKPIFEALENSGLQYAFVRHLGILFNLYNQYALGLIEELDAYRSINDADILINFDRNKIDEFVVLLRQIPGLKDLFVEFSDDSDRKENQYLFSSDCFISFNLAVPGGQDSKKVIEFEIFANYGIQKMESFRDRVIFASLDENGESVEETNFVETVDFTHSDGSVSMIPCMVGKGIGASYNWQNSLNRERLMAKAGEQTPYQESDFDDKPQLRTTLAQISSTLVELNSL